MKKYIYNPQTLNYEPVKTTLAEHLKAIAIHVLPGAVIGGLIFFSIFKFFVFPDEARLLEIQQEKTSRYEVLQTKLDNFTKNIAEFVANDNELYRPMLEMENLSDQVMQAGMGGIDKYTRLKGYENSNLMIKTGLQLDFIVSRLLIQSQSFEKIENEIAEQKKRRDCYPDLRPVRVEEIRSVCTFGMRMQPIMKIYRMHKGVDLVAPKNTDIFAAADGKVIAVKYHFSLGHYIKISHGYGHVTVYGHLEKTLVKYGQKVKKGEKIALMGTTGLSNVDHLHYEIYKNGKEVNPFKYFYNDLTDVEYESLMRNNSEAEGLILR